MPAALRDDPLAVAEYVQTMAMLAEYFERNGHPELSQLLFNSPDSPIAKASESFKAASHLAELREYSKSSEILSQILRDLNELRGTGVPRIRAAVFGMLGTNCFHLQEFKEAQRYTELALQDCKEIGDQAGIAVYSENLRMLEGTVQSDEHP